PTMYVVGGIGTNGCRSYDTVRVGIDYRDNLFIPTAFSPNGDGKNDVFRVSNMTFQRFVEFRVFNRWGQEIYNSISNKGWDGTWKGVAQETGNYQYLIRVAYPDGYIETYKGDVTLVR
ncbi:MAG: gliding motility-associated C-terminal domain-containing protein, partial [Flavipsychrobacter sp.]|nr:gliding motility-associated C-terminal domain-containing protein [Flavipsychrobacter sp.]